MARVEEPVRRNYGSNSISHMNTCLDNFIDVSDFSSSSVLYELTLNNRITEEDQLTSFIALPSVKSTKKAKVDKTFNSLRYFLCSECGSSFTNASNLKSHFRTHTGERPYICNVCGKSFIQSSNLKSHKRIHSGEKPYKCKECGKGFSRSTHLISHQRIHTGETPYACTICTQAYNTSTQLKVHMQKHSQGNENVCGFCQKMFSNSSSLAIHVKLHSGERPFICILCTAAFRSKEDLIIHRKLHIGLDIYPYACEHCGKGFKIALCCNRHQKKCEIEKNNLENSEVNISIKDYYSLPEEEKRIFDKTEMFHIPESVGEGTNVCKMEMLESSIEDGIENEVDQQTMVFMNDGDDSLIQVIASGSNFVDMANSILPSHFDISENSKPQEEDPFSSIVPFS